jgi:DNA adenine methylase
MRPIFKSAGGKTRMLPTLLPLLPAKIGTYVEPFVGGGAVFFALAAESRFERAVIADSNPDLIAAYRATKDHVHELVMRLRELKYDRDVFYETREQNPIGMGTVARAARFIYLNKTCFNGLWRVNRSGQFNVPFGKFKTPPTICDAENLHAASIALQKATIMCCDFEQALVGLRAGDVAFMDPPYVPVSKTANFTSYTREGFGPADQERLDIAMRRLRGDDVDVIVTNADTETTRDLYAGFERHEVTMRRNINSKTSARGAVGELIVWNR